VILVVCAVRAELRGFAPREGVEELVCGVGPVEAAVETARMLATSRFDAVVNAGLGGAFRGRARIGDAVIVAEERFAEFGLEGGRSVTLPDGVRLVDRAFASDDLLSRIAGIPYATGTGVTVAQVTTTDATAERLRAAHDADVESMEGFAVLRACERAGVPALEVRGISNYVGDRSESGWDFDAGSRAAVAALDAVLDRLLAAPSHADG
jgi:futalosine hydrolase